MARFDLTDFESSVIQPLLPTKVRGVKRVDDRRVLNGIFWRLRTGVRRGRTFRRATVHTRPASTGSTAGGRPVYGRGY
jgi:transposase